VVYARICILGEEIENDVFNRSGGWKMAERGNDEIAEIGNENPRCGYNA